ncbi:DUF2642 domain-containing protein [Heliorestis acidaminivorans]|uniref:DUF2642 domain-containing protein n=1 Tax=Heliorestis acidaminivorans TaxID=553427 RepID=A0A6I0F2U2_9FIRM|nr:DUF2642 domain-containing protein [Heliorestis acidaminivorans]KAB2952916.1 DUF2642 domain-containing protein [Heliorestis acidaminivorans]
MHNHGINQHKESKRPMQVVVVEPYVYRALHSFMSKRILVETSRGTVNGIVVDIKPDHVVVQDRDSTFFVRLREVIWVMPIE